MIAKSIARIDNYLIDAFNTDQLKHFAHLNRKHFRNYLISKTFLVNCEWFDDFVNINHDRIESFLKELEGFWDIDETLLLELNVIETELRENKTWWHSFVKEIISLGNLIRKSIGFADFTSKIENDSKSISDEDINHTSEDDDPKDSDSPLFFIKEWENQIRHDKWLSDLTILTEIVVYLRFDGTKEEKKRTGSYYTPSNIILYLIEHVLGYFSSNPLSDGAKESQLKIVPDSLNNDNYKKVYRFLDYACGMGGFIFYTAAIGSMIRQNLNRINDQIENIQFPKWEYWGFDNDPITIKWVHWIHEILMDHPIFGSEMRAIHFIEINALKPLENDLLNQIRNGFENENSQSEEIVDFVLSNPPYVSWGLGRVDTLNKTEEAYYRKYYPNSAEYKISLYAMFIERSIQLLKPGGIAGLIVPDSFLFGKYFDKIRLFLLDNCQLLEFLIFQKSFWKNADSGNPTIIIFQKITKSLADEKESVVLPKTVIRSAIYEKNDIHILNTNLMPQEYFRNQPKFRFRLFFTPDIAVFVQNFEKDSQPLNQWFELHHGIRSKTGIGKGRITNITKQGPEWKAAIISGSAITPYHVEYQGQYILINPDYLFSGGFNPIHIEQDKILLRRTGDTLIAAVDTDGYYHTNTLIYLIPKLDVEPPMSLYALCAILNSDVMNKYYQAISMKKKRTMAQVEIDMIEQLPIKLDPLLINELDSGSRTLHSLRDESYLHTAARETRVQIDNLITLLNSTVYLLYFSEKNNQ